METRQHPNRILTRQQLQRIEEPWFLNKMVAVAGGLLLAMVLGYFGAIGDVESLILAAVWITAVAIIVFVRDYWWSPVLIITALAFHTYALGFAMTGLEIGVVILFLTFPVKMAMKTLRPVSPTLNPGIFYWALLSYVLLHCLIIVFYNKIDGVQLKNIIKAYYRVITPLVFYGLLLRYCETRTVKTTAVAIFMTMLGVSIISIPIIFLNLPFDALTSLRISVDWANSQGAAVLFRYSGPFLLTAALAWWPVARSSRQKLVLLGALFLAAFGVLLSGGRGSMVQCIVIVFIFSVFRRKIWVTAAFALLVLCASLFISANPRVLYALPDVVHRTLLPLNISGEETEIQSAQGSSDRWHHELLTRSLSYWFADTNSIFFGHGYKSWDDQNTADPDSYNNDFELMMTTAIQMGITENMFSSVTNIYGLVGLVLYSLFMLNFVRRLWFARRASPAMSAARAICEFSLVNLLLEILFAPFVGGTPNLEIIFWSLGLLAARHYIGEAVPERLVQRQSFDRAHENPGPRPVPVGDFPPEDARRLQTVRPRLSPRRR